MSGYLAYYLDMKKPELGVRAAEWTIAYLQSLKADPEKRSYLDKMISLYCLTLANLHAVELARASTAGANLTAMRGTDQALLRAENFRTPAMTAKG